ncbi:MAG: penicillin-binding protein 2 [Bacteroidota bacterium]
MSETATPVTTVDVFTLWLAMDEYRTRSRLFAALVLGVLVVLGLRLVQLQIVDTQAYSGASRNNAVREVRVKPARGVIYDRQGILMVDNEPTYNIAITPRYFDTTRIDLLADLLEVPDTVVRTRYQEALDWSGFQASRSFPNVTFDQFSRVQEHQYRLPGVSYEKGQKRRYLTDARAAHALGYIREIGPGALERQRPEGYRRGDLIGQAGVERTYEPFLRGDVGSEFVLVNVHGRRVQPYRSGVEDIPPSSGYDLHLTIDSDIQALAESLFVNKRGGLVALDPRTGAVLAMVSKPDFDPGLFSRPVSAETWNYLQNSLDKPMFNRATQSGMAPGSTWKPFMALMALQEGLITPTSRLSCPGFHPLGNGRTFRCMGVHGSIDVGTALQTSCNTFFFELMMRTDVNTFSRYANAFGFGVNAPTDINEQWAGTIPDSAYFNRVYPRGWTVGYSINLGVGQGNMVVTPLQLARYMGAVAMRGTIHAPHLVDHLVRLDTQERVEPDLPEGETLPVETAYFDLVREGMRRVMEQGTGRLLQIPGIPSGGKTGTAQVGANREDNSAFVMFAPYDDPQIAIAAIVENAGFGSVAAGPIASLVAEQYLTGQIADTPTRRLVLNRALTSESEPLDDGQ